MGVTYHWDFSFLWMYRWLLVTGLGVTVLYTVASILAGLVIGLGVGLMRLSRSWFVNAPLIAYIEAFRCTPILVQLIWFYYALPILLPFQISPLTAAALGISLNSAAFSAEIFRGGIESIDRGQAEAARALGMTAAQAMRRIVLPQALRRMLPALTNRGIEIFKMTTLASAVAYVELLQQGKLLSSLNFNPIETYTVIALVFFLCLFPLVQATYALERRLGRSDS